MHMQVKIKKLNSDAQLPVYGSPHAAGADLFACIGEDVTVQPHQTVMIPTGLAVELPAGYAGFIYARSGLASKRDLAPANKVGVVDCDYRGEVKVALHNHGETPRTVARGERIAQLVVAPYVVARFDEAEELSDTVRGEGGFGSTGSR